MPLSLVPSQHALAPPLLPTEARSCASLSSLQESEPGSSPFRKDFPLISENLLHFKGNPIKGLAFGF